MSELIISDCWHYVCYCC